MSSELYRTSLQQGLDLYAGSYSFLNEAAQAIDVRKGKWGRKELNPSFVEKLKQDSERARLWNKHLGYYHGFEKTSQFSAEVVTTLQSIHATCDRPAISEDTYATISRLGENAKTIREKEEALATVNHHIQSLATKVDSMFKKFFERRVYEIRSPLNSLLVLIDPSAAYVEIPGGLTNRTVANAYPQWLEKTEEGQKKWTPRIETDLASSAQFESQSPDFAKLDAALKTLNLTYIDPETHLGYGVAPAASIVSEDCVIGDLFEDASPDSVYLGPVDSKTPVTPLTLPKSEEKEEVSAESWVAEKKKDAPAQSLETQKKEGAADQPLEAKIDEKKVKQPQPKDLKPKEEPKAAQNKPKEKSESSASPQKNAQTGKITKKENRK